MDKLFSNAFCWCDYSFNWGVDLGLVFDEKKKERLLEGLKSEVRTNQLRIEDSINALQKTTTGILIFPLESRVYEQILFEYPSLIREVYGVKAEEALGEVYGYVKFFNLYHQALTSSRLMSSKNHLMLPKMKQRP